MSFAAQTNSQSQDRENNSEGTHPNTPETNKEQIDLIEMNDDSDGEEELV
jgi:hypothetical protein